jgi:HTH-type transcriptional regulator/antitoxin HipB
LILIRAITPICATWREIIYDPRDRADMSRENPTPERIAEAVRAERKRQGLDQRTLALVANVGQRSIYRIENGEQTVRLDVLLRVLAALGLQLDVVTRRPS